MSTAQTKQVISKTTSVYVKEQGILSAQAFYAQSATFPINFATKFAGIPEIETSLRGFRQGIGPAGQASISIDIQNPSQNGFTLRVYTPIGNSTIDDVDVNWSASGAAAKPEH